MTLVCGSDGSDPAGFCRRRHPKETLDRTPAVRQLQSAHSSGAAEDEDNKTHDLGGKRVLVSETFAYRNLSSIATTIPRLWRWSKTY